MLLTIPQPARCRYLARLCDSASCIIMKADLFFSFAKFTLKPESLSKTGMLCLHTACVCVCVQLASPPHPSKMTFYTLGQVHSRVSEGKGASDALEVL